MFDSQSISIPDLARLGVLQLRGGSFPLAVEPPPQLDAVAVARSRPGEERIRDGVLDALEQAIVHHLRITHAGLRGDWGQVALQLFLGLALRPDQELADIRPVAAQVSEGPVAPDEVGVGRRH